MLNKVFLQGRLVADPDLRHTQQGTSVASFRLAVEHDFKNQSTGERGADFINIVAWRGTADFVSRYFSKGRMALVEGRPLRIEGGSYRLCEGGGEHCGRPCRRRHCARKENEQ